MQLLIRLCSDPKLAALLPASQPSTPQKPKLVLAQNNPHLRSHRRRQSSVLSIHEDGLDAVMAQPGMEHTRQLADVLYNKWADGLRNRWPAVG